MHIRHFRNNFSFRTKALIKQLSGTSVVAISPLHTECPLMMRKPLTHSWLSILLLINALRNLLQYFSWISSLFEIFLRCKKDIKLIKPFCLHWSNIQLTLIISIGGHVHDFDFIHFHVRDFLSPLSAYHENTGKLKSLAVVGMDSRIGIGESWTEDYVFGCKRVLDSGERALNLNFFWSTGINTQRLQIDTEAWIRLLVLAISFGENGQFLPWPGRYTGSSEERGFDFGESAFSRVCRS